MVQNANQSNYSIYYPETGEVMCCGMCSPADSVANQLDGWPDHYVYSEAVDGETHYMVEGAPAPRPELACASSYSVTADAQDEVTIALPAGTAITFQGETSVTDGDDFAFTTDIPGTYVFRLTPPFPFIPLTLTIEAADAV
ncbi:hypothetical protein [Rhizobium sp. GN54]|uniref:hypothetical protein n=1 Tax=Rhizobium sp. GN54 TaxID=2898150 RepID=UPI001E5448BE|nr:hypothetical protein [Rhizobium sp. GN54]MCD2184196.1 hypothetical protein [Rhizobium sp. GN54]